MSKAVMIVEGNDARRAAIRQSLTARGLMTLEVPDAFSGLAALGRADFGAIIVAEGKRHLSLKGLIQLAKKRHGDIRIFVILSAVANAESVMRILGTDVIMVPPEWGVEQLANSVNDAVEAQGGPPANPWQGESDAPARVGIPGAPAPAAVPQAVDLPVTEDVELDGLDDVEDFDDFDIDADLHLEGSLEDGSGAGLLMGLFTQELTGRLDWEAQGAPAGRVYFYQGEPVWADDPDGDAGLFRRLVGEGLLAPTARPEPVPQGQLLPTLVQGGALGAEQAHELMQKAVREHALALATAAEGSYVFNEDKSFLEHAPLLKINPFGLIFESRRRGYTPDKLLAIGSEIAGKFLHPGPGLAVSSDKLSPFIRNIDVHDVIDGKSTVESFTEKTGLDMLMGTLMVLTLADSHLVSLSDHEMVTGESVVNVQRDSVIRTGWPTEEEAAAAEAQAKRERSPAPVATYAPASALTDDGDAPPVPEGEATREELLQLYVRMKPLTAPAQVLGVPVHAEEAELNEAYRARMGELDDNRVPACEDADQLRAHLDELRRKVQHAYDTLRMETPAGGGPTMDSNPF